MIFEFTPNSVLASSPPGEHSYVYNKMSKVISVMDWECVCVGLFSGSLVTYIYTIVFVANNWCNLI